MDSSAEPNTSQEHQNVVVMRHGDRMDNFEPLWVATAKRPWDPPLFEAGRVRAFCKGRRIRTQLGFPIHRVFVSPFLRCVQTAFQAISALCAVDDSPNALTADEVSIDPSKVKVIYDSRISKNWPMIFIFLQVFINSKLIFIPTSSLFCMKISP
jgi:broad specificity phosphatase PhoE